MLDKNNTVPNNYTFSGGVDITHLKKSNTNVMALCLVELGDGLSADQICKLVGLLPADGKYMPIEFHSGALSAYGFVNSEYYEFHDYGPLPSEKQIYAVLSNKNLEHPDGMYLTPDGLRFYMGYCNN